MTNIQLYVAVGLPVVAVISSLVISLVQISGIRDEIRDVREQIRDVRQDIREIRGDIKLLTGKVYELMGQQPG